MSVGINKYCKVIGLGKLNKIRLMYMNKINFADLSDLTLSKNDRDNIASLIDFSEHIYNLNIRKNFLNTMINNPSNLARVLGYDAIFVENQVIKSNPKVSEYKDLEGTEIVLLNRGAAHIMQGQVEIFKHGLERENSNPESEK